MPWTAIVETEEGLSLKQITKPHPHGPRRATNSAEAQEWATEQYKDNLAAIVEIELNNMWLIGQILEAISPYLKKRLAESQRTEGGA